MKHECRITVLETKCFPDLQKKYLANPNSGPCPFSKPGQTFLLKRTPQTARGRSCSRLSASTLRKMTRSASGSQNKTSATHRKTPTRADRGGLLF